jgi:predicted component of type VI protein secretion system
MLAQLVSLADGPNIVIDKPILLIGRHPECDIQIDSRKISRRHCCIAQVADYLVVRDLGSTNGIRINGVRVLEGRLNENDELMIAGLRYRISRDGAGIAPDAAPAIPRKAEPLPPRRPIPNDNDELLEACNEPVPLLDPPDRRQGAGRQPLMPRARAVSPPEKHRDAAPPVRRAEFRPSHIASEDLDLTPARDPDESSSHSS